MEWIRGGKFMKVIGPQSPVVHMAAFCEVGASVEDPASYYRNNVGRTLELLDAVRKWKVPSFVFSSAGFITSIHAF